MRMLLGLSEALPSLVDAKYRAAKASQAVVFSATDLAIIRTSAGVPVGTFPIYNGVAFLSRVLKQFQLRYCPSLAKKSQHIKDKTPKPKFDPFANPEPELFITNVPASNPSHVLVLNKFPIISNHFIIATKENKPQTHRLEEDDLEATFACLKAWEAKRQERLFAFFNSGPHSGASQSHRHLQFLPVDSMHEGEKSAGWDLLISSILSAEDKGSKDTPDVIQNAALPFAHFAHRFDSEPSGPQLLQVYSHLYGLAKAAVDNFMAAHAGQLALNSTTNGELPISYNLAMTTAGMAILPRRSEGHVLRGEDGTDMGHVQLNGTALGGTLMVKYKQEWDLLRSQPKKLDAILDAIGVPILGQTMKL